MPTTARLKPEYKLDLLWVAPAAPKVCVSRKLPLGPELGHEPDTPLGACRLTPALSTRPKLWAAEPDSRQLLTLTSLPRLMEARRRFVPSPLPICQIRASAAWFLKGQSLACSSYQIVLQGPRHTVSPQTTLLGWWALCAQSPRLLLQPSSRSSSRMLPGEVGPCSCYAGSPEDGQAPVFRHTLLPEQKASSTRTQPQILS